MLRQIRTEHSDFTLDRFKQVLRDQYLSLLLDRDGALAAIPGMLPADDDECAHMLATIRKVVSAAGEVTGERAARLAEIEGLFRSKAEKPQTERTTPRRQSRRVSAAAGQDTHKERLN
jgi:hypothetical protein